MGCGASSPAKPEAKPQAKPAEAKADTTVKTDEKSTKAEVAQDSSTTKATSAAPGDVDDGVQPQDQAARDVKKSPSVARDESAQAGRAAGPDAYDDDAPQMAKASSSRGKGSAAARGGDDDEDADEVLELPGTETSMGFRVTEMAPYSSKTSESMS